MPAPPDGSLEGVVVATTRLAHVDGRAGVALVRGYPLDALARKHPYESVAHLVLRGELPDASERAAFLSRAAASAAIPADRAKLAASLGAALPSGDALVSAIVLAEDDADRADADAVAAAERVLARVPAVCAAVFGTSPADPRAPYARRAALALGATRTDDAAVRALEVLLCLESEHGLSVSAFAARVAASSGASLGASLAAACAALSGTRHGGATAEAHALLAGVLERGDDPDAFARDRIAAKARLPGFGHRVYKVNDPRVPPLREAMLAMGGARLLPVADAISARVDAALGDKGIHANVDLYGAVLLDALGVLPARYAAAFALGVAAGWLAHALEVRERGRLVRPDSTYDGPPRREV